MDSVVIVESYEGGASLRELAQRFSIPVQRIRDVLVAQGISIRSRGRAKGDGYKISKKDRRLIIARYMRGEIAEDIAVDYDVSKEQICVICRDAGVIRKPGRQAK
jgi:uncharacterized protein (DUF433 family)